MIESFRQSVTGAECFNAGFGSKTGN